MTRKLYTPTFFLITVMNLIILTANNVFVLYPLYLQDIGKTKTEIGLIIGIYSLAGIFARFYIGTYLDKIGRRFFVRLGIIMFLVCAVLYSFPFRQDAVLMALRLIHGLAYGFYFTAVFTWIADFAPEGHLAEAIGIFGVSGLLTTATGPVVGEWMLRYSQGNFLAIFAGIFIMWVIGLLLSFPMKELFKPDEKSETNGFMELLSRGDVLITGFIGIVFGIGMSGVYSFIAPYVREYHLGNSSTFFIPYTAAAVLVRIFFGRLTDRHRTVFLVSGFVIMTAGQYLVGRFPSTELVAYIGFFLGIAHGLVYPAMVANMLDRVGSTSRGRGMGLINAFNDTGMLVGASTLGMIADYLNFASMFIISGFIIGGGLVLYLTGRFFICSKK